MSCSFHEWRFEVGSPDHGSRLDSFLSARLAWRSRQGVKQAIETSRVEVLPFKDPQGAVVGRVRSGLRLRVGQEVVVCLPAPQAEVVEANEIGMQDPASVVHEDDHLLVVDKQPHRSVYPSRRHRAGSLIEWVHRRHRSRWGPEGYFPTPCHRLDRETSGLVLFAKSRKVRVELGRQFEERSIRKRYLAVVHGCPVEESGLIDAPLGHEASSRVEMRVGLRSDGRPALTRWRRLRSFAETSLVELEPKTGRRHQLRAHMASAGYPIVGDKLYSGGDAVFLRSLAGELTDGDRARLALGRQALHAWRLELDPESLEISSVTQLSFEAPLAADIRLFLEDQEPSEILCPEPAVAG